MSAQDYIELAKKIEFNKQVTHEAYIKQQYPDADIKDGIATFEGSNIKFTIQPSYELANIPALFDEKGFCVRDNIELGKIFIKERELNLTKFLSEKNAERKN